MTDEEKKVRDLAELTETFEKWFTGLLLREGSTCLERDVLRNQKKNLRTEWLEVRPTYTTTDLETAKIRAKTFRERLFDDEPKV